ncbi:MAG: pyridoxal-phosphate dependent enzyme [Bacteroidetes bacterium]|nr:pyridoxal-phosphate dependent enzyme [Bacteroidota bacterium]
MLDIARIDLIHPEYGGNKLFKLELNVAEAIKNKHSCILTFGGLHSNHIFSTSAYCRELRLKSIGVIRAYAENFLTSPTLFAAQSNGMQLEFAGKSNYKLKNEQSFINELKEKYGDFYLIPEGGANKLGVEGCFTILNENTKHYDYIFCACGTATTYTGLLLSAEDHQKIVGISVLNDKGSLCETVKKWLIKFNSTKQVSSLTNSDFINSNCIISGYEQGGYAKTNKTLINFKQSFEEKHQIKLDYIYTSKLFYAVFDIIEKKHIPSNCKVLIVHSGGTQGNKAFEEKIKNTALK